MAFLQVMGEILPHILLPSVVPAHKISLFLTQNFFHSFYLCSFANCTFIHVSNHIYLSMLMLLYAQREETLGWIQFEHAKGELLEQKRTFLPGACRGIAMCNIYN